jgi:uncharacterized protein (UPF0332 family)
MNRQAFLIKIREEGKLQLVRPSSEVAESYLSKSESSLSSAKILLEAGHAEEAVSMAYYSMYYTVLALLFRTGIKCENHTAAIMLLKEIFTVENDDLIKAKKERVDKQYYIDFSVTAQEVKDMIRTAERFNAELAHNIASLDNDMIKDYRAKMEALIDFQ